MKISVVEEGTVHEHLEEDTLHEHLLEEEEPQESGEKYSSFLKLAFVQGLPQVGYFAFDAYLSDKQFCLNGLQDSENGRSAQANEVLTVFKFVAGMLCIMASVAPSTYGLLFTAQGGKLLGEADSYKKALKGLSYVVSGVTLVVGTSAIEIFLLQPWIFDARQDSSYMIGYKDYDGHNQTEATCLEMGAFNSESLNDTNLGIGLVPVSAAVLLMFYNMLQIPKEPRLSLGFVLTGELLPIMPGMIYTYLQCYTPGVKQACLDGMNDFAAGYQSRNVSSAGSGIIAGVLDTTFAAPLALGAAMLYGYQAGTILSSAQHLCKGVSRALASLALAAGSFFLGSAAVPLLRSSVRDASYANGYKLANFTSNYCDGYQEFSKPVSEAIDTTTAAALATAVTAMIAIGFLRNRKQQQQQILDVESAPPSNTLNRNGPK